LQASIEIIGVGSVGSFIALALAKMGMKAIRVWDADKVQEHNLPNQFYRIADLNKAKTKSLQKIIKEYTGNFIRIQTEPYNGQELKGIVISAVDSLETRAFIWKEIQQQKKVTHYIDTRMGAELMKIYPLDMKKPGRKFYERTLKPKHKIEFPCTGRTILYNVLTIAGLTTSLVKKILKKEELPQRITFDLKTLIFIKE
jgi:hypothetical protein